jgi:hypothetical protein
MLFQLDTLLHQLHTLSFFLSPSILALSCRFMLQYHCKAPREWDPSRPLRVFLWPIIFVNAFSVYNHATEGAAEGRAIVLDFVGLSEFFPCLLDHYIQTTGAGYVPSKAQLLILDIIIIFLQMLLTTIAYETSISEGEDTRDILLPIPSHISPLPSQSPSPSTSTAFATSMSDDAKLRHSASSEEYVIDLRWSAFVARLRGPTPSAHPSTPSPLLPLPNTTSWPQLPTRMMMMMNSDTRAGSELQSRTPVRSNATAREDSGATDGRGVSRIPGDINVPNTD